jgi:hypothetical protein
LKLVAEKKLVGNDCVYFPVYFQSLSKLCSFVSLKTLIN